MASVYKRSWITKSGQKKSAWVVTWVDRAGKQHRPQRATKRAADSLRLRIENQLAGGGRTVNPDRTIGQIATAFLADFEALWKSGKRERVTFRMYDQQVRLHLEPFAIAKIKAAELSGPDCLDYARELENARNGPMAQRIYKTFRMVLDFGCANGWLTANPAKSIRIRVAGERAEDDDQVEIPPKADLRRLLMAAERFDNSGRAAAFVWLLMTGGLRISELRALPRFGVDVRHGRLRVAQRADRWNKIGPVKSKNGRREVPLPPAAIAAVKRWLKHAPASELGLLFPTGDGTVESHANLYHRLWLPLMRAAGLAEVETVGEGDQAREIVRAAFAFHALRHVAVSLWIEQGTTPKRVQDWAGHASIQFTMDVYGHLWPDRDGEAAIAAAAQRSLLGQDGSK